MLGMISPSDVCKKNKNKGEILFIFYIFWTLLLHAGIGIRGGGGGGIVHRRQAGGAERRGRSGIA
jgi:hypothetical protein